MGVTRADVEKARERLQPYIRHTPIIRAHRIPQDPAVDGLNLYFKLELLQVSGSFKARGALNAMLNLHPAELRRGIVTASGGNHGRAVAYAAWLHHVPADIFVPRKTRQVYIDAMAALGAHLHWEGEVLDDTAQVGQAYASQYDRPYIHNFNNPHVIAGNGTQGLEILDDLPEVDTILVACGGGGMLAGICVAVKEKYPRIKIIGVEPEGAATLTRALEAGHIIRLPEITTQAGTLALATTFDINFDIIQRYVDGMVLISDADMLATARWLWRRFGIAAEMAGAAAVAAVLKDKYRPQPLEKVCAIICGVGADGLATTQE